LAYLWFIANVKLGRLIRGDPDPFWIPPHWTLLMIWIPAIAAFWADGIGMTLGLTFESFAIGFIAWLGAGLTEAIVAFLMTGNTLAYGQIVAGWVFFISQPIAFCYLVFLLATSAGKRAKMLAWARRWGQDPFLNLIGMIVAIAGLILAFAH
jgi:hypothetical protein